MKKILIFSVFCFIISGCTTDEKTLTYQSDELGIAFEYPEKFGLPDERRDEKNNLTSVGFDGAAESEGVFEIGPLEKEFIIPSCTDVPTNSPREKCQMMTVDGHSFLIYQVIGDFDEAQQIQLQTKEGMWRLITGNPDLYDETIEIAKTIKYLK